MTPPPSLPLLPQQLRRRRRRRRFSQPHLSVGGQLEIVLVVHTAQFGLQTPCHLVLLSQQLITKRPLAAQVGVQPTRRSRYGTDTHKQTDKSVTMGVGRRRERPSMLNLSHIFSKSETET